MVRIPSEYQEVEYLESTGTQYIDTDHVPTLNTKAHVIFSATVKNTIGFFGSRKDPYRFCCTTYSNGTTFGLNVCKNSWTSNKLSLNINTIYDCEFGNGFSKINGQEFLEPTLEEWDDTIRAFVLSGVDASGSRATTNAKYYLCELWENNVIVRRLIPCYRKSDNVPGMYDTVSKTFFTNSGTGTFLVGNDVNYSNTNLLEVRRRILLNTPHIESMSGNPAIFTTDMAANLKECKIRFSPVQAGEGTPSPENVRAISGWDGVSVTKASKNLIDFNTATYIYHAWVNNGVIKPTASYNLYSFKIPQNTILTLSRNKDTNSVECVCAISTEDAAVGRSYSVGFPTITNRIYYTFNSGDCNYLWFCIVSSADISIYEWQLEVGNNRTSYDSPSSTSISIPFPQTIFGGYVDLIKGEVVETHAVYNIGDLIWAKDATLNTTFSHTFSNMQQLPFVFDGNIYCTTYNSKMSSTLAQIRLRIADGEIWGRDSYKSLFIKDNRFSDAESFKDANNGQLIIVPLATPNTYSLTPQTIKVLKGLNNLWSNANGNIEVKFWSHEQYQTFSGEYEITDDNYLLTTNDGYVIDF